jgi:hypothetical protein
MEFRFEDILKKIIPGSIVFGAVSLMLLNQLSFDYMKKLLQSDLKEYSEILLFIILIGSYLFGYLNDSISSTLENYILYKIIKKPSYYLLTNSGKISKLKIANLDDVLKKINENFGIKIVSLEQTDLNSNKAFKLINQCEKVDDSLKEYYFSYIFSRNIFFASIFLSIAIVTSNHLNLEWFSYPIILLILAILYVRRIEKSFYYSRKVIVGFLHI